MSWLLFLDESGHEHKTIPHEVFGGIALKYSRLWPLARGIQQLELAAFGCSLREFQKELKGSTFLDKTDIQFRGDGYKDGQVSNRGGFALYRIPHEVGAERHKNRQRFRGYSKLSSRPNLHTP